MSSSRTIGWRVLFAWLLLAGFVFTVLAAGSIDVSAQADKKDKKKEKKKVEKKDKKDKKEDPPPPLPKKKEYVKDKTPPLFVLKGHADWINSVAISADGKYVITASRDKTVKVWDLSAKKEAQTFKDHPTNVRNAVLSPDGKYIVTTTAKIDKKKGTFTGEVRFLERSSGKVARTLSGHTAEILALVFAPGGDLMATGAEDGTAIVWDVKEGKALHTLKVFDDKAAKEKAPKEKAPKGKDKAPNVVTQEVVHDVAFNKDGSKLAAASSDRTVTIWDVKSGKKLQTLTGPERDVTSVAFAPEGGLIAGGSLDEYVYIWDESGKVVHKLDNPTGIWDVTFSPNGRYLVATGWDDTIKVWDAKAGKELFHRNGHTHTVTCAVFSPDNQRLITVGIDQTIRVWEVPQK